MKQTKSPSPTEAELDAAFDAYDGCPTAQEDLQKHGLTKETGHPALGPWFIVANLNETSPLHPMCSVWSGRETKESIVCNGCSPSDAKLIAAAPTLLEAAKEFVTRMDEVKRGLREWTTLFHAEELTLAAIAKAEGQ